MSLRVCMTCNSLPDHLRDPTLGSWLFQVTPEDTLVFTVLDTQRIKGLTSLPLKCSEFWLPDKHYFLDFEWSPYYIKTRFINRLLTYLLTYLLTCSLLQYLAYICLSLLIAVTCAFCLLIITVESSSQVKITDFGLAKVLEHNQDQICGSGGKVGFILYWHSDWLAVLWLPNISQL